MNDSRLVRSAWQKFALAIIKENQNENGFLESQWAKSLADFANARGVLARLKEKRDNQQQRRKYHYRKRHGFKRLLF